MKSNKQHEPVTSYLGRVTYKFNDDLMNAPVVVSTVRTDLASKNPTTTSEYMTALEGLPVKTFRAGAWGRDIIAAHDNAELADKYHDDVLAGKK